MAAVMRICRDGGIYDKKQYEIIRGDSGGFSCHIGDSLCAGRHRPDL